ncbi:MAG: hypothetical protein KJ645_06985, partial [Planctomycetes bacterium]|nr:hypothetical protein [Planctomycetota bacterium]
HQWWNVYGFFSLETNMRSNAPAEKFQETYGIYQRALELKPDYPRYVNDLAMLIDYYLDPEGKRKDEVEGMYRKAFEKGKEIYENPFADEKEKATMFSAFTDALVNLTRFYLKEGRLDESRATLTELLDHSPDRYEAVLLSGVLDTLSQEGIDTTAPDCYRDALLGMAHAHLDAGSYRECLGVLQELMTIDPEHAEVVAIAKALNAALNENKSELQEDQEDNPDEE